MRTFKFILALTIAAASANAQETGDPPSRVARLNYIGGSLSFRPGIVDEWTAATLNYPLYNGDHLWAGRDSRAELHLGSTAIRIGSESALAILDLDDRMVQLSLTDGALQVHLRYLGDGESFEVDTPNGAVTLLRAGDYHFFVDGDRNTSTVTVRAGDAEVTAGGRAFPVHPRDSVRLSGIDDNFAGDFAAAAPPDEFESWCQSRDRREEQSQSVRHVSRETIGYEDLDEHGAWSETPDYGWVWAPRVSAGWAPYQYGHWVWVEPWGWTWVDDAPWGFAPFHYGRWANMRGGWVWVPGSAVARPVYAPALVAFVGGPGFSVSLGMGGGGRVAWFPLGPREVYRPAYRVSEVYVRQVNITHVNVTNINVTNVRYVNQNVRGAVVAVPQGAFVGARPVHSSAVLVSAGDMSQARVGMSAGIAPERASVLGRPQAMGGAAPPTRFADRTVVVRHAPPPPPVSFAARREGLQSNPGRPMDPAAVESLRRNDRVRAPMVRQAAPISPANRAPMAQPAMRDNAPPRNDRPRQQAPQMVETPRREPRVQQQQPQQPARQLERPQPRNAEQPRREAKPERKVEERKAEPRKPVRKEDRQEERKQN